MHARIARTLLETRNGLGGSNMPTVITGDCNPFASDGNSEGSFESVLIDAGFHKSHQAVGDTGGYRGLDKIFASVTTCVTYCLMGFVEASIDENTFKATFRIT